jgi:hypothetical protein
MENVAPKMALVLQGDADALRVRWRESGGGESARLESAALVVRQGPDEETVNLLDRYAPDGGLAVPRKHEEMVVSLRVRREGQPPLVRTVTYVDPGPARRNRRGGELEWLRWRNRELEKIVATLQEQF